MSIPSKIKILETCVTPVLTYRAYTWTLSKKQTESLKKKHKDLWKEVCIVKIRLKDRVRKEIVFKFAGHVMKMEDERLVKRVIDMRPYEGKR